jgi:hypothetical protein
MPKAELPCVVAAFVHMHNCDPVGMEEGHLSSSTSHQHQLLYPLPVPRPPTTSLAGAQCVLNPPHAHTRAPGAPALYGSSHIGRSSGSSCRDHGMHWQAAQGAGTCSHSRAASSSPGSRIGCSWLPGYVGQQQLHWQPGQQGQQQQRRRRKVQLIALEARPAQQQQLLLLLQQRPWQALVARTGRCSSSSSRMRQRAVAGSSGGSTAEQRLLGLGATAAAVSVQAYAGPIHCCWSAAAGSRRSRACMPMRWQCQARMHAPGCLVCAVHLPSAASQFSVAAESEVVLHSLICPLLQPCHAACCLGLCCSL